MSEHESKTRGGRSVGSMPLKINGNGEGEIVVPKWMWGLLGVLVAAALHGSVQLNENARVSQTNGQTLAELSKTVGMLHEEQVRRSAQSAAIAELGSAVAALTDEQRRLRERVQTLELTCDCVEPRARP